MATLAMTSIGSSRGIAIGDGWALGPVGTFTGTGTTAGPPLLWCPPSPPCFARACLAELSLSHRRSFRLKPGVQKRKWHLWALLPGRYLDISGGVACQCVCVSEREREKERDEREREWEWAGKHVTGCERLRVRARVKERERE